jgi:microcystin-dependent protein
MKITLALLASLLLSIPVLHASQDVPNAINYQGRLLNGSGNSVADGSYTLDFKVYGVPTGTTFLWGSSVSVNVTGGFFNVVLGEGGSTIAGGTYTAIASALAATSTPFLGIMITSDNTGTRIQNPQEIAPRLRLLSSPYAVNSQFARLADVAVSATNAATLGGLSSGQFLQPASSAASTLNGDLTVPNLTVQGGVRVRGSGVIDSNLQVGGTLTAGDTSNGGFVPVGGIILWSGTVATIPSGWALCDGNSTYRVGGTTLTVPDLRNRFVFGASDSAAPRTTGGSDTITLTEGNLPPHSHVYKDSFFPEHSSVFSGRSVPNPESLGSGFDTFTTTYFGSGDSDSDNNSMAYMKRRSESTGGANGAASPITIRPPYYALAYIIRTR